MPILNFDQGLRGGNSGGRYFHREGSAVGYKIYPNNPDEKIRQEYNALCWLQEHLPGVFPKPYGLKKIHYHGKRHLAIKMEHIEGECKKQDGPCPFNECDPAYLAVLEKLDSKGLRTYEHDGGWNTILTPWGEFRLIDADPGYLEIPLKEKTNQ